MYRKYAEEGLWLETSSMWVFSVPWKVSCLHWHRWGKFNWCLQILQYEMHEKDINQALCRRVSGSPFPIVYAPWTSSRHSIGCVLLLLLHFRVNTWTSPWMRNGWGTLKGHLWRVTWSWLMADFKENMIRKNGQRVPYQAIAHHTHGDQQVLDTAAISNMKACTLLSGVQMCSEYS